MIILITGASHTGKTLLAQRMLEKIQIPMAGEQVVVIDHCFEDTAMDLLNR